MLKQFANVAAHAILREKAHEAVAALPGKEIRTLIHREAPVLGRIYTALTSEQTQRTKIHTKVGLLSHAELRATASDRVPPLVAQVLTWLDR